MRFLRSNRRNNYDPMYINRTLGSWLLTIGSLLLTLGLMAEVYTPYMVPNPRTTDGKAFVADPDHLLSADERNAIQDAAEQLHTLTGVEMVTVLLDDIGEADAFDFAYDLFNEWGIGDSETNTGVLLFFTMQQHDIRITTGKGLEGLLPDAVCYDIIVDDIIPLLRQGQYGAGLLAGNQAVTQRLTTQQALQELLLGYRPKEPTEQPWKGLSLFALFIAMIAGLAYWAAPRCPQCKKKGARTKDEILVYATYTASGRGIHHHTCRSCGHRWDEPYTIAKRTRSTSFSGRGGGYSSSGGTSGGSFGGGSTSGGGAGGKW